MNVRFAAAASAELMEAELWYRERGDGLGDRFLGEVERALRQIEELPRAWPVVEGEIRKFRLWRFPYAVIYVPLADDLLILAIAHARRKPDVWRNRGLV